jgi:putative RNA 2'-phosphotransferase
MQNRARPGHNETVNNNNTLPGNEDQGQNDTTQQPAPARIQGASKFMAYVLRHHPDSIGITLGEGGWVPVADLVAGANANGYTLDADTINQVLAAPGKKRYELRDGLIRASQGHSVQVDLGLERTAPPPVLYHGTVGRFLDSILATGLKPGSRTHVHLSATRDTAVSVGARRGFPVILLVDAAKMARAGHEFFIAANGVWLTAHVPAGFLAKEAKPVKGQAKDAPRP